MKKLLIFPLLLSIILTGCNNRDDKDLSIFRNEYLNVTEQWGINTYNGYRCSDNNTVYDESEDTYTVTFKFTKLSQGGVNKEDN